MEKNDSVLEAEEPEMTEVRRVEAEESPEDQSTETQSEQLLDLIEIAHEETDVNEEEVAEEEVAEPEEIDPEVVELEEVGPHEPEADPEREAMEITEQETTQEVDEVGLENTGQDTSRDREERPVPPSRRSTRECRRTDRFSDYVMHGMQAGPYDVKLQAISSLVTSGALGSMDSNMAKKILENILK